MYIDTKMCVLLSELRRGRQPDVGLWGSEEDAEELLYGEVWPQRYDFCFAAQIRTLRYMACFSYLFILPLFNQFLLIDNVYSHGTLEFSNY